MSIFELRCLLLTRFHTNTPQLSFPSRLSLQILRLEELHHAIAVLIRRQIPQRDAHAARHHAVHHRQRRLVHALVREALVLPNLLDHHLFGEAQRRVRGVGYDDDIVLLGKINELF